MTAEELVHHTLSGGTADRVPALPKIWLTLAARMQGVPVELVAGDPAAAMRAIVEAAITVDADAVRLFHFPPRRLQRRGEQVFELDAGGKTVGPIDLAGGLATHAAEPKPLDDPMAVAFASCWSAPRPMLDDLARVDEMVVPPAAFYDRQFGAMQRQVIHEYRRRIALLGDCGSVGIAFLVGLRGMQTALMDLLDDPDAVLRLLDIGAAIAIEKGRFAIDAGLRLLRLNDSAGNMSVISPDMWRKFVKPSFKRVCDALHAYCPDVRIYCHICGNTLPIMEDLVETGLDAIGPLDPLGGFSAGQARQAVGRRAALLGGVGTLSFVRDTPDAVRRQTELCIEQAGTDGGFMVGSGCAMPPDSRVENIRAMTDAAHAFSR